MQVELKLKSKVPVLARICPSETITLTKTPQGIRIDWSIAKIIGMKMIRSPMSFLFRLDQGGVPNTTTSTSSSRSSSAISTTTSRQRLHAGARVLVVNHEEEVYEELYPQTSPAILHDLVDTYLRDGVRIDEMPLLDYRWTRSTSTNLLGKVRDTPQKTMSKSKFKAALFQLSDLSWRQQWRSPIVQSLYDRCTEECLKVRWSLNYDRFLSIRFI
jgi:hypothetical protein